jgi:uncharacterized protein (DUF1697 family)
MTVQLAFLRGINVGGRKMVGMADLRDLLTELGFRDVRSLLQSGNLIFDSGARPAKSLEALLEEKTEQRLGVRADFFVRTAEELDAAIAHNPFPDEAKRDPAHLLILFLRDAPSPSAIKAMQGAIKGPELVRARGREAYLVYPEGIGRSKLTAAVLDKHVGTGTGRNWNTILKLAALAKQ